MFASGHGSNPVAQGIEEAQFHIAAIGKELEGGFSTGGVWIYIV